MSFLFANTVRPLPVSKKLFFFTGNKESEVSESEVQVAPGGLFPAVVLSPSHSMMNPKTGQEMGCNASISSDK